MRLETRYHDIRPKAPEAVFELLSIHDGAVRLGNTETRRTILVQTEDFNRNYEEIKW